jgi:hypothetical protein
MLNKGVLLLHDNARPHSVAETVNLLTSRGWEIVLHPPYSHDLHRRASIYSQRWKSTSVFNNSTPMKMFKMKSRNVKPSGT